MQNLIPKDGKDHNIYQIHNKTKFDMPRKKNGMAGLTVSNNSSNSAYTRAEKLLNYKPSDNGLFSAH